MFPCGIEILYTPGKSMLPILPQANSRDVRISSALILNACFIILSLTHSDLTLVNVRSLLLSSVLNLRNCGLNLSSSPASRHNTLLLEAVKLPTVRHLSATPEFESEIWLQKIRNFAKQVSK